MRERAMRFCKGRRGRGRITSINWTFSPFFFFPFLPPPFRILFSFVEFLTGFFSFSLTLISLLGLRPPPIVRGKPKLRFFYFSPGGHTYPAGSCSQIGFIFFILSRLFHNIFHSMHLIETENEILKKNSGTYRNCRVAPLAA